MPPDDMMLPDHPERRLAVAHADRAARADLATVLLLDERLATIVARAREPGIGLMRLLWWRDALAALDQAPPPAEPLLVAAAALGPRGIAGRDLAAMTEGWEVLLDDPDLGPETLAIHARERGARLFALAGRALGDARSEGDRLFGAGEGWALVELARHVATASRRQALLDIAREPLDRAMATRWPGVLRPLGMLAALASQDTKRDAEALRPTASRPRLLRLLVHRWTGL